LTHPAVLYTGYRLTGKHHGLATLLALLGAANILEAQRVTIREASGICRQGDSLYVVDDSAGGVCFRVPLKDNMGPLISLNTAAPERVSLSPGRLAIDLEGIDFLADGRLAALSERMRSLVGKDGVIVEYDSLLSEFAKRGLEGIAVRPRPNGSSRIAVVWEGGYPDVPSVPRPLLKLVAHKSIRPFVLVHDLKPDAGGGRVRLSEAESFFEVELPLPPGEEPQAQRFRASDLVWYPLPGGGGRGERWGFILLISSQNSVEKPDYLHHWLLRINPQGKPVGDPLDLAKFVPESLRGVNWEGLSWFEPGKRLVLVHEADPGLEPHAFILDLPPDWQFQAPESSSGRAP